MGDFKVQSSEFKVQSSEPKAQGSKLKAQRIFAWLLTLPIVFYQRCITPYTPPSCRFTPTCSEYARQAILKHGPIKGTLLAAWRILRCNPWGGSGYDPVPDTFKFPPYKNKSTNIE